MSKRNNYEASQFDEDWGKGVRERKDKPGKKHNNNKHQEFENNGGKKNTNQQKPKQPFKRHSDNDDW